MRQTAAIARWTIPSLFLVVALWIAFGILAGTAPAACDELPRAFDRGVKTEVSDTLGGLVASHCEYTVRATHVTVEKTVVNWSGLIAAVFGCVAAWLLGAAISGLLDRRQSLSAAAASLLVSVAALVAFFA